MLFCENLEDKNVEINADNRGKACEISEESVRVLPILRTVSVVV